MQREELDTLVEWAAAEGVPENNPAALAIAQLHRMKEVFGCAKMYFGPKPTLPDQQVFGVTTFELG